MRLAALEGLYPTPAAILREWWWALDVGGRSGPSAAKPLSPGKGREDSIVVEEVHAAARLFGLAPLGRRRAPFGWLRLPTSMRSRGRIGKWRRYYLSRWGVGPE